MDLTKLYIWDIETYKELFSFSIIRADGKHKRTFEVSYFKNELQGIYSCIDYLEANQCYLVGFNNIQFDYPVLHEVITKRKKFSELSGHRICTEVFKLAQKQIDSFKCEGFGNTVKKEDIVIPQIDLFKIHHFDNKAKMTSLKIIEFNMKLDSIKDLPYDIHQKLTPEMIREILIYNEHDVEATRVFFEMSIPQVQFRFDLTDKYKQDFLNHNDGKLGKSYFQMRLEESGVKLSTMKDGKKVIRQTKRSRIDIGKCLFDYYDFDRPECLAIKEWFSKQVITETKGVFSDLEESVLGDVAQYAEMVVKHHRFKTKPTESEVLQFKKEHPLGWIESIDLKATVAGLDENGNKIRIPKQSHWGCFRVAETLNVVMDGLRIDFGVGGIHASRSDVIVNSNKRYKLVDADVASMYPNIAISNRCYPLHLGEGFCDIYKDVYEQRKSYAKNTPENAMMKLALNSVYGDSNNKFSVFYDPMYTMQITINGQLSLLLLVEKLLRIDGLRLVQLNTDGVTVMVKRGTEDDYYATCKAWEQQVKLQLEYAEYSKMCIRDVNNYIALYDNGKVKRKGAYEHSGLEHHKNQSALVIPKAVEQCLLYDVPVEDFIMGHTDIYDFLLRTKVPRSSRLVTVKDDVDTPQQNICRYYPSKDGGKMVKIMPPLVEGDPERRLSIDKEYNVKTCNDISDFDGDVDYAYYINEAKKLLVNQPKDQPNDAIINPTN